MKINELTESIIAAAIAVHRELGLGLVESLLNELPEWALRPLRALR